MLPSLGVSRVHVASHIRESMARGSAFHVSQSIWTHVSTPGRTSSHIFLIVCRLTLVCALAEIQPRASQGRALPEDLNISRGLMESIKKTLCVSTRCAAASVTDLGCGLLQTCCNVATNAGVRSSGVQVTSTVQHVSRPKLPWGLWALGGASLARGF